MKFKVGDVVYPDYSDPDNVRYFNCKSRKVPEHQKMVITGIRMDILYFSANGVTSEIYNCVMTRVKREPPTILPEELFEL